MHSIFLPLAVDIGYDGDIIILNSSLKAAKTAKIKLMNNFFPSNFITLNWDEN